MKKNKRSSKVSGKPLALTWLCLSPPTDSKTYFSNIRILIRNDYPIVLHCDIAGLGFVRLCLAPNAEEE